MESEWWPEQQQFEECLIHEDGALVEITAEIAGLTSNIQTGVKEVDGCSQNGKKGLSKAQSADASHQVVYTFDGLILLVPTENVQPCSQPILHAAVERLSDQKFCVLQTCQSEELRQKVVAHVAQKRDWTRPKSEFAEAYMGIGAGGQLAWLSEDFAFSADDALQQHMQCITNICGGVGSWAGCSIMGVGPMRMALPLLRSWHAGGSEGSKENCDMHTLSDFTQHRKLCVMLVVDGAGTIELHPKGDDLLSHVELPVRAGMLLIFRNDLFLYSYTPSGKDVMLQAWLLEQPEVFAPDAIQGSSEEIKNIIGATGVRIPLSRQTHVLSFAAMFGGNTNNYQQALTMYPLQTDCGLEIPITRWDNSLYYEFVPDGGYAVTPGTSAINHSSFLLQEQFLTFNHDFFGFTYEEAEQLAYSARMLIEGAYNCLTSYGYTKETLRGALIGMYMSGCRREAEGTTKMAQGFHYGKKFGGTWQEEHMLSWLFGIVGPAVHIDTACSASLVGINAAYNELSRVRDGQDNFFLHGERMRRGLIGASGYFVEPMAYVGLSGAHMLGSKGRNLTYDMSACGFARGEGCKFALLGEEDSLDMSLEQYATMIGGATNQDGRSASLTAPSGPSQSQIVRQSLKTAGRVREEVSITETHGTGTALGDPIEVGSMRAVMFGRNTSLPLFYGAGKSITSHLEMGAGLAGFIKMTISLTGAVATPNNHLRELNSNIDAEGYPAFWSDCNVDMGFELLQSGQASFGFGGTNSRADLWASAKRGPRRVAPVIQVGGQAVAGLRGVRYYQKLRNELVPELVSETGGYMLGQSIGDTGDPGRRVYIVGSWTNFSEHEEMQQTVDGYLHFFQFGHSRQVQFYMVLDKNPECMLYPMSDEGHQKACIGGPDGHAKGRKWIIDGSESIALPGDVHRIMFTWDYGVRQMSWAPVTASMKAEFTKEEQDLFEKCQHQDSDCQTLDIHEESDASTADT